MRKRIRYLIMMIFLALGLLSALYLPTLNVPISSTQNKYHMRDIHISLDTISPQAKYIDVLIKIDETSPEYCQNNERNLSQIPFDSKIISDYNSDGFVSISAHYNGIVTDINMKYIYNNYDIESDKYPGYKRELLFTNYENDTSDFSYFFHKNLIEKYHEMKIIVFDENGNVLDESDQFSFDEIKTEATTSYVNGSITYDMDNKTISVSRYYRNYTKRNSTNMVKTILLCRMFVIIAVLIIFVIVINALKRFFRKNMKRKLSREI